MTLRKPRWMFPALVASVMVAGSLTGCGEEPQQAVAPPPPPRAPAPPPPPPVMTLASLMAEMGIDQRVRLEETKLPATTDDRRAVLEFFDCFARADDVALAKMMPSIDRIELTALVESGVWKETCAGISSIEVQCGTSPLGDNCALAVFQVHGDYQAQLWYYKGGLEGYTFDAVRTPPDMMSKLHGDDWIQAWHDILKAEEEIALAADIEFNLEQENLDESGDDDGPADSPGPSSAPGPASSPSGPGGPPSRRPPPRQRRRAPGPGGG